MADITSLLAPAQRELFEAIRHTADELDTPVFIVGGAVRDWLLDVEAIDDLDFVVEGDAIAFAFALQERRGGMVQTYPAFGTATWHNGDVSVDLAMSRRETYSRPAALPTVAPADLEVDLRRRDFTINAMAMRLNDRLVIDPLGGRDDLRAGVMRVIHERSFVDDPTRILRGARYAARFDFSLESATLEALVDGLPHFRALSGERVKHDLELTFDNHAPEHALIRLSEWGVFRAAGIPVPANEALVQRFVLARAGLASNVWTVESLGMSQAELIRAIGWGALTYNVGMLAIRRWVDWIPFEHHVRDTVMSLGALSTLSAAAFRTRRSRQSELLHEFSGLALYLGHLFDRSELKRKAMVCEWTNWRWVRPITTGDDLVALGLQPGPAFARLLQRLRQAWQDGEVKSYLEEQALLQALIDAESLW
jgi:tRNA nucleotidyltransferase (CCA-adding enzyme)